MRTNHLKKENSKIVVYVYMYNHCRITIAHNTVPEEHRLVARAFFFGWRYILRMCWNELLRNA